VNSRRWRIGLVWLAAYVLFLVVTPFEHHDLLCELKTPFHCTACTSTVVGSDPARSAVVGAWTLTDLGSAVARTVAPSGILLPFRSSGRSPPVFV
jgi:hypothetical protein